MVLTGAAFGVPTPAAVESANRAFDIPAETAETALRSFAEQADAQFVFSADKVKGVRTNALKGSYAPREALDRLVSGTALVVVQDDRTGALTVDRYRTRAMARNSPTPNNEANMKKSSALLGLLATVFSSASYGQVAPAQNPPASTSAFESSSEQAVVLPEYQVTGSKANQYNAENAASVARIASSILDSPLTVNVISPALLEDLGTTSMVDDVTYFAGMSWGRGAGPGGIGDRMDFRGFESLGGRLVDNFSEYLQPSGAGPHTNVDPVLIDRAELVMGPDAILAPTGSPGGTMNLFTKSPLFDRSTDISMQYGNYYAGGVSVDTTGPIGDGQHMAYRVIGDYQEYRCYIYAGILQDGHGRRGIHL